MQSVHYKRYPVCMYIPCWRRTCSRSLFPGLAIASIHAPILYYSGYASFTVVHKNHLLFPGLSFTFIYPIGSWKLGK